MIEMATTRSRDAVLREMGLGPIWRLRGRDAERGAETAAEAGDEVAAAVPAASSAPGDGAGGRRGETAERAAPRPLEPAAPLPSNDRAPVQAAARDGGLPPSIAPMAGSQQDRIGRIASLGWDDLEMDIQACRACSLCERRRQAVPGVGDRQARWMLVGEAPGAEEDQRGEPFVGQAGRLLDNMLAALGLHRGEGVYITNAVKCRPPHNRTPEASELTACLAYLQRQIELVRPTLLIALGRPAAQALLDTEIRIGAARGRAFRHAGIPVVVTYHPAYLLRNPQDKAKAWEDLCFARRLMAEAEDARANRR